MTTEPLRLAGPDGLVLRTMSEDDVPAVLAMLHQPEIARWWGEYDLERLRADIQPPPEGTVSLVIEEHDAFVGLLQFYEELDRCYRFAGIDVSLRAEACGRGLGSSAVRVAARHLVEDRGHHRLVIDPAADNARAIAAYTKVGFRPVGVLRRYERRTDGAFADGLLMDLLAEELT